MGPLLALSAAVCWGTADFIGGRQARHMSVLVIGLVVQLTGFVIMVVVVPALGRQVPPPDVVAVGLVTGAIGALVFCCLYASLAMGNMARVAPVLSISAVIPIVFGLAGEDHPSQAQLLGIVIAIGGIALVSTESNGSYRGIERSTRDASSKALAMAVLTAVGIGTVTIGIDHVAEYDPYWATFLMRIMGAVVLATLAFTLASRGGGRYRIPPASLRALLVMGVLETAASLCWAIASSMASLSLVATLGATFPAVTVVLALIVLRAPLSQVQAVGVVVTLLGGVLVGGG